MSIVSCQQTTVLGATVAHGVRCALRSGGFDTGAAAVRLPAIGRPSQVARISPMEPPRGVPVSNPPRLRDFPGFQRPRLLSFAPADRASEAGRAGAPAGARP